MSPLLKDYLNRRITIVTTEGRCIIAKLEGYDKNTNLVLSSVVDYFASAADDKGISIQMLRGSEVVICGLLEDDLENNDNEEEAVHENKKRKIEEVEAVPIKDTKNIIKDEHLIWEKVWEEKESHVEI
ncbi:hypothetical protein TPHA_0A00160 [Tetrapisispora phaffii CBS 4417]|uniref:LSM2-LSM8 complex subunit LSM8 n=1 Tax=Tetrapisispora phaffii (strain ATCC 24235 / CBS 4417 / NBRC 1672 / NRRL Y-8282 / UCD 70-5) TaxID=1071381 RepID=G8BMH3_TETPH|nr:hypothetical protein TPHA_0A00160 [Tetrapisispora phaffii CBS 4417]CCE61101.1 hypothetical protein TPHA_0A00160 [Tetrapisispora phaffii CBS 4417]